MGIVDKVFGELPERGPAGERGQIQAKSAARPPTAAEHHESERHEDAGHGGQ